MQARIVFIWELTLMLLLLSHRLINPRNVGLYSDLGVVIYFIL